MPEAGSIYNTQAWRKASKACIARANGKCEIKGPKCTGRATTANHKKGWAYGGAKFDQANLEAACRECNSREGRLDKVNRGWQRSNANTKKITLRAEVGDTESGDVILSKKALMEALGGSSKSHRKTMEFIWCKILEALRAGELPARRVTIISDEPNASQIYPYHRKEGAINGKTKQQSPSGGRGVEPGRL